MSRKTETITVHISRQVLWIGASAYPLQNIARAQARRLPPNRAAAWRHNLFAIAVWLALGIVAAGALNAASSRTTSVEAHDAISRAQPAVLILVVILVALSLVRLTVVLSRPTYYMLVIETADAPHAALVSTSEQEVSDIVYHIMLAIDNPQETYTVYVQNQGKIHIGDDFSVSGHHNVGKA